MYRRPRSGRGGIGSAPGGPSGLSTAAWRGLRHGRSGLHSGRESFGFLNGVQKAIPDRRAIRPGVGGCWQGLCRCAGNLADPAAALDRPDPPLRCPAGEVIADAGLPGRVGCAVADAATGEMLEVFNALYPLPPASVAKAVTTAYGLDRMGPGYRFRTTLVTDGTMRTVASTAICGLWAAATRCSIPTCSTRWPRAGRKRDPRDHGHVPYRHDALARHLPDRPRAVAACGLQPLRLGAEPQLQPRVLRMGARGRGLHRADGCAVGQAIRRW
jgi:hypothetical protein